MGRSRDFTRVIMGFPQPRSDPPLWRSSPKAHISPPLRSLWRSPGVGRLWYDFTICCSHILLFDRKQEIRHVQNPAYKVYKVYKSEALLSIYQSIALAVFSFLY